MSGVFINKPTKQESSILNMFKFFETFHMNFKPWSIMSLKIFDHPFNKQLKILSVQFSKLEFVNYCFRVFFYLFLRFQLKSRKYYSQCCPIIYIQ